ncbi:hypothetical protein B7760_00558 [Burkholderia glumae]|nr:hypothetical protein B7760_00558 [Burkholderia glumae]
MKQNEFRQGASETVVLENDSVYAALCNKINLKPVAEARPLEAFRDNDALSEASAGERVARGMDALLMDIGLSLVLQMPKRPVQKPCSARLKMFQQMSEQPSLRNAS